MKNKIENAGFRVVKEDVFKRGAICSNQKYENMHHTEWCKPGAFVFTQGFIGKTAKKSGGQMYDLDKN